MKIAFACYLVAIAGLGAWGVVFLMRSEFMPYHAVAVGMSWSEVPPPFQVVILAVYKLAGEAWVVIALALLVLLFGPFRHGATWAQRAIPALILIHGVGVINAMAYITLNSPAMPPWKFTIAVMLITVVGYVVSITDGRDRKPLQT